MKIRLVWFWMLSKRLYKKPSFWAILLLIPIAICSLGIAAQEDSGFVHVVLSSTDADDPISTEIIEKLMNEDSLIRFTHVSSPKEATNLVINGEADSAWIFPSEMQEKINLFAAKEDDSERFVTVIEREQTIFLRISHEKLTATLQSYLSKAFYLDFARTNSEKLNSLSDPELIAYYDNININQDLFVYDTPAEEGIATPENDYLTAPIRGLLAIVATLSGMAAALYFLQDQEHGTFSWVAENRRIYVAFICLLIAILNVGLVIYASLFATGLAGDLARELINILLYSLCCASFCLLLLALLRSIRVFAALMPMLIAGMIVVCPVFFELKSKPFLQHLFPPTYFINSDFNESYMLYMPLYALACFDIAYLLNRKKPI